MSKDTLKFNTPPMLSVSPAAPQPVKVHRKKPKRMSFENRLSTPNVAIRMKSPNLSPIPATSSVRSLNFQSPRNKNRGARLGDRSIEDSFNNVSFISPMEKSFRAPLNDHLDLGVLLKEYDLFELAPVLEANGITIANITDLQEPDFISMGIFKLNELHSLKQICSLLNDSQNNSY